ncbi:unnamed protein product [Rotaria sp. Silwood1]|nr:unnamed protein product [Rotaria sp. Silwood1]
MTTVSSSGSSCLSPIRYSLDVSQINQSLPSEKPTNFDQNIISIPMEDIQLNQLSLPIDDSSVEPVCHAQNYSSGQILSDTTTNTSIQRSFLKSSKYQNVSGPVLSTPGYLNLKKEFFFNTIDWNNLVNMPTPFIPVPVNDSDTFYFEDRQDLSKLDKDEERSAKPFDELEDIVSRVRIDTNKFHNLLLQIRPLSVSIRITIVIPSLSRVYSLSQVPINELVHFDQIYSQLSHLNLYTTDHRMTLNKSIMAVCLGSPVQ